MSTPRSKTKARDRNVIMIIVLKKSLLAVRHSLLVIFSLLSMILSNFNSNGERLEFVIAVFSNNRHF